MIGSLQSIVEHHQLHSRRQTKSETYKWLSGMGCASPRAGQKLKEVATNFDEFKLTDCQVREIVDTSTAGCHIGLGCLWRILHFNAQTPMMSAARE